jgi:hypothetical protein
MSGFRGQDYIDPDDPELDYTRPRLSERPALFPVSRPIAPKAINVPARRTGYSQRRAALVGVATGVAAVVTVVAVAALLFVIFKPALRQLVASSSPFEITGSTPPQSNQRGLDSKPALAASVVSTPSQPDTHEQAQQLLQGFLQWRETQLKPNR